MEKASFAKILAIVSFLLICGTATMLFYYFFFLISQREFRDQIRKLVVGCNPLKLRNTALENSSFKKGKEVKPEHTTNTSKAYRFCTICLHVIVPKLTTQQHPKGREIRHTCWHYLLEALVWLLFGSKVVATGFLTALRLGVLSFPLYFNPYNMAITIFPIFILTQCYKHG